MKLYSSYALWCMALAGCASMHNPNVDQAQASKDQYECERDSLSAVNAHGLVQTALYRDCMKARGYK